MFIIKAGVFQNWEEISSPHALLHTLDQADQCSMTVVTWW